MIRDVGRGGAVARCLLAGLLAVALGWAISALVLERADRLVRTSPPSPPSVASRVARLNVAWTAALGAPLDVRPMAEAVTCSGRLRLALAPLVLLASLGLLACGALLARREGCHDARGAILTGGSVALPAAMVAGLVAWLDAPPLCVPLEGLGRLALQVTVRPLEAAGAVLACGLVAGAVGGVLASAGRRAESGEESAWGGLGQAPGSADAEVRPHGAGEESAWGGLGQALVAGLLLLLVTLPAGWASLACVRATPEVRASLASLEKGALQELPRAGDLLAVALLFAGQPVATGCGGRVQADMIVASVPREPGDASEGAESSSRLSLCGGFKGETVVVLPWSVRAGVLLPLVVAVLVGWRAPRVRRGRVSLALACTVVLVAGGLWLSTWCDLVLAVPGVLPGMRVWGWWRPEPLTLAAGAAVFGMLVALAVPGSLSKDLRSTATRHNP